MPFMAFALSEITRFSGSVTLLQPSKALSSALPKSENSSISDMKPKIDPSIRYENLTPHVEQRMFFSVSTMLMVSLPHSTTVPYSMMESSKRSMYLSKLSLPAFERMVAIWCFRSWHLICRDVMPSRLIW